MARRLLLDTTALIEYDRTGVIQGIRQGDKLAVAAISLAELYRGVVATPQEHLRDKRLRFYERLTTDHEIEILPYTADTARVHGFLLAFVKSTGAPRGAHDLIIAAHARETGREIFSADSKARFGNLPGVSLASLTL